METEEKAILFINLPGDKVEMRRNGKTIVTVSKEVFEWVRKQRPNVNWTEFKPGDVVHSFEDKYGRKFKTGFRRS